jgi:hypothetical protein
MKTVKNSLIALVALLSIGQGSVIAQQSIAKGDLLINPGLTLGWYNYNYGYTRVSLVPPVNVNFEYAVMDLVSVGVELDYAKRGYKDVFFNTNYTYDYRYTGFSVRGSFHYLDLLKNLLEDNLGSLNSEQYDFYVGFSMGMLATSSIEKWTDFAGDHERKYFDSIWRSGYYAGFRYYFSNSFGVWLETGRANLGWGKLGITLRL